jgi:hypothetical protein
VEVEEERQVVAEAVTGTQVIGVRLAFGVHKRRLIENLEKAELPAAPVKQLGA